MAVLTLTSAWSALPLLNAACLGTAWRSKPARCLHVLQLSPHTSAALAGTAADSRVHRQSWKGRRRTGRLRQLQGTPRQPSD